MSIFKIDIHLALLAAFGLKLRELAGQMDDIRLDRERLDALYHQWNKAEYIAPDPLETLSAYPDIADREVAGLLAASMAYGRVSVLLNPLKRILSLIGISPRDYVCYRRQQQIESDLEGIAHRFAKARHFAALLAGVGAALNRYGNLENTFLEGYESHPVSAEETRMRVGAETIEKFASLRVGSMEANRSAVPRDSSSEVKRMHRLRGDVLRGLSTLVGAIGMGRESQMGYLLPLPEKGSACKRLLLYLRWMVRLDDVDPGGWLAVNRADLLIPLDTWTYRIAVRAGWSNRKSVDMRTVREVSAILSSINPEDPIKYDFALSRFGIRSNLNLDLLFAQSD